MYIYKFRVVRNPEKIKKKCCDLQVSRKPMFIRVNIAKSVEKYHFIVMFTVMNIIKLGYTFKQVVRFTKYFYLYKKQNKDITKYLL